jgi:glycosyltransferase involved in cell wall biosynthesis
VTKHHPQALLINTHSSALVAAMAAKWIKNLGQRCHLYVRDFLWRDLDFIFHRLQGARVIAPSRVVEKRIGYLKPFFLEPFGMSKFEVIPDMVEMPSGGVQYDGPLLHLATVNPWKGHLDLMLALSELKTKNRIAPTQSVGVIGDVVLQSRLLRLIQKLELSDYYELKPYMPDPDTLLRSCRALVLPSVSLFGGPETFGRATIEAWSYRKPVISYDCGASAELIEHGVDGLLVPEGDTSGLAQAIDQLNSSPHLCRRLGEAGFNKVMKRFEASMVTNQLIERILPFKS